MKFFRNCFVIIFVILSFGVNAVHAFDSDGDGLSDEAETTVYHTDINNPDTDGDGFFDGLEIENGYSPRHGENKRLREVDSDQDLLWDDWEISLGTDLTDFDTDNDGYHDGAEVINSYDPMSSSTSKIRKHIEVDIKKQELQYFYGGKVLDKFLISGGLARTPTPLGDFKIIQKRPVVNYGGVGFNYPDTKWNLLFTRGALGGYYIHGAWWHDNFGKPMSHGCVNVEHSYEYMGRLYDWADLGTEVIVR